MSDINRAVDIKARWRVRDGSGGSRDAIDIQPKGTNLICGDTLEGGEEKDVGRAKRIDERRDVLWH